MTQNNFRYWVVGQIDPLPVIYWALWSSCLVFGDLVGPPYCLGQSISLVSKSGGRYNYILVVPGLSDLDFVGPHGDPIIVLSGLSGVTGGAYISDLSPFGCGVQISKTASSVTFSAPFAPHQARRYPACHHQF